MKFGSQRNRQKLSDPHLSDLIVDLKTLVFIICKPNFFLVCKKTFLNGDKNQCIHI